MTYTLPSEKPFLTTVPYSRPTIEHYPAVSSSSLRLMSRLQTCDRSNLFLLGALIYSVSGLDDSITMHAV